MAVMQFTPLFALSPGFGPLGLSLDPQDYAVVPGVVADALVPPFQGGSSYASAQNGGPYSSQTGGTGARRQPFPLMAAGARTSTTGPDGDGSTTTSFSRYLEMISEGERKGIRFPLPPEGEIVIGRVHVDITFEDDEQVSRRHAKIMMKDGNVVLEDLGSTAGTFVNGKRIRRPVDLKGGERISIGTQILSFAVVEDAPPPAPAEDTSAESGQGGMKSDMSFFVDSVQFFGMSRRTGVMAVASGEGNGRIVFRDGKVTHCSIEGSRGLRLERAFYRMIRWHASTGTFTFVPQAAETLPDDEESVAPVDSLLMEGMRQLDEIQRIQDSLPALNAELSFSDASKAKIRDLKPEELDIVQLVGQMAASGGGAKKATVKEVLDRFEGDDLKAYALLLSLMTKGIISAS